MKILQGIKSGALLQRDNNDLCTCLFKAEFEGEVSSSLGKIEYSGENLFKLKGIKTGGPYEIIISDSLNEVKLTDIYVGDLWILAGQSNMEGAGRLRGSLAELEINTDSEVRCYYMSEAWAPAKPQLHQIWEIKEDYIRIPYRAYRKGTQWKTEYPEVHRDGVGPGYFFAKSMKEKTKVPQGVIPCAVGGSCLKNWETDRDNALYAMMKRRVAECGNVVKGVFWHQGESQCNEGASKIFVDDMKNLVNAFRRDFNNEKLPFIEAQLHKFTLTEGEGAYWWSVIRDKQRTLYKDISNLLTVNTCDLELDDMIHLSGDSHRILGERAANAMLQVLNGDVNQIDIEEAELVADEFVPFLNNIVVKFKNLKGALKSNGIPYGFYISKDEKGLEEVKRIIHLKLEGDKVYIKNEIAPEEIEDLYLSYAYGCSYYANITDSENNAIPAFGPIKIKDLIK